MHHASRLFLASVAIMSGLGSASALESQGTGSTTENYRHAENFLPWNIDANVHNNDVGHNWIAGSHRLWYKRSFEGGYEFIVIDAARKTRARAFDHDRMAQALTRALGREVRADQLPIDDLNYASARNMPTVVIEKKAWACDLQKLACTGQAVPEPRAGEVTIPGGQGSLFVKDYNLWLRDADASERPLTTDGDRDRSYAVSPEASTAEITNRRSGKPPTPVGVFSPDGAKYITYRLDQSKVKPLHLLQSVPEDGSVRPVVHEYRYAFPGDTETMAEFFIFDLQTGKQIRVDHSPVVAPAEGPIAMRYVSWSADGRKAYLTEVDRSYQTMSLTEIDAGSGRTRLLRSETETINYLPAHILPDPPLARVLANGDVIWPSERSGSLHLYRYDGRTGALKNPLTPGSGIVREIIRIDEAAGLLYFSAMGAEGGSNPYYRSIWRVRLNGTGLTRLTDDETDHEVKVPIDATTALLFGQPPPAPGKAGFSPDGAYFVDSYSTPTRPTVTLIRDARGRRILDMETASLGSAIASYVPPEPFRVMAADGKTPIYGLLVKPRNFDPAKRYPLIDSIYPGPQVTRTPTRFMSDRYMAQSVAELGFVVMIVDGRGTPLRSREFRSFAYGNMGAAGGLEDHVAAIRQLTPSRPWLDGDNVGIYGTSGGGFATVHAMFDYPDVFKVGVASAGNHDQRSYLAIWGENYQGPFDDKEYEAIASYHNVRNFKGKLLIAHGDMDDNVHPANTMRVVDQLIKSNKTFDMLIMPNVNHGIQGNPYFTRRLWDYFVVNMKGEQPPTDFVLAKPE